MPDLFNFQSVSCLQSQVSGLEPIVLTGSSGFIGRHVLEQLRDASVPVVAVDRVEPEGKLPAGVRFHRSDLSDPSDLIPRDLDVSGSFVLVHLAWDMRRATSYALHLDQARLLAALLDYWAERGLSRVVGIGSAEEYGARSGLIHEYDPPMWPLSPYGAGKHAAYGTAISWALREKRDLTWLRPFLVYGPGQSGDMMLPYAVAKARAREPAEFTDGLQERDFVHVADVAEAVKAAVFRKSSGVHVLNLGAGIPVQVREVLMEVARLMETESVFHFGARPRRPGEPERQVADISSAHDLLGWTPKIGWREGVAGVVGREGGGMKPET